MTIEKIATYHSPLKEKFGTPRQSGLAPSLCGRIVFEPAYRDANALRGLEEFDYIWLIWGFSANRHESWSPTVRPPRLGGNAAMGVFATRSPFRPNPLGLSAVKIESIRLSSPEGPVIQTLGADLMDGTPIYDIKPYIAYADAHVNVRSGFVDSTPWKPLDVVIPEYIRQKFMSAYENGKDAGQARRHLISLEEILSQDPRPQYIPRIPSKVYGISYAPWNIKFTVSSDTLSVIDIAREQGEDATSYACESGSRGQGW